MCRGPMNRLQYRTEACFGRIEQNASEERNDDPLRYAKDGRQEELPYAKYPQYDAPDADRRTRRL